MSGESQFTHFTADGRPEMVDVSGKAVTKRVAVAHAAVVMQRTTREAIEGQQIRKGDVLAIGELAGIMAAKRTAELIPLCHQVPLHHVSLSMTFAPSNEGDDRAELHIEARTETAYQTGVEMEALTACSVAALTVYDMCKAIDRGMTVKEVRLVHKSGGKSGVFQAISK